MSAGAALIDPGGQVAHAERPDRRSSGLATSRHRRAWLPVRRPPRSRRRDADHPASCRSGRADTGRQACRKRCAPPRSCRRHRSSCWCRPCRRSAAERLLRVRRQCAEAHASDRDWNVELDRALRRYGAEQDVRSARFAIALQRVPRDARAQGTGGRRRSELRAWRQIHGSRRCPLVPLAESQRSLPHRRWRTVASQRSPRVRVPVVELSRRPVAPKVGGADAVDSAR